MAQLIGHVLASNGDTSLINGPSTDVGADGLGQQNALGERAFDNAGGEYVYLKGVASLAAGDWVLYNNLAAQLWKTTRFTQAALVGFVAVAMAAVLANSFGWFQIYGQVLVANIDTDGSADGKTLSSNSATTGRVSTGATATKVIYGAFASGASAANVGAAFISYPYTVGIDPI